MSAAAVPALGAVLAVTGACALVLTVLLWAVSRESPGESCSQGASATARSTLVSFNTKLTTPAALPCVQGSSDGFAGVYSARVPRQLGLFPVSQIAVAVGVLSLLRSAPAGRMLHHCLTAPSGHPKPQWQHGWRRVVNLMKT